jgi:hypothetical protein
VALALGVPSVRVMPAPLCTIVDGVPAAPKVIVCET